MNNDFHVVVHKQGWAISKGDRIIEHGFETNAQAWRHIDKIQGEPTSRRESVMEWSIEQNLKQP